MFTRLALIALIMSLLALAAPFAHSQSDCDYSDSHYARAVQLHDMGDYTRALRHYDCALAEDPDNEILPVLIANLNEDIASASSAWSVQEAPAPQRVCQPELDHEALGAAALDGGDAAQGMLHLKCALALDGDNVWALRLYGSLFMNRGETRVARYFFDRAEEAEAAKKALSQPAGFQMPDWLMPYETVNDLGDMARTPAAEAVPRG